jgi:hypothetical protein
MGSPEMTWHLLKFAAPHEGSCVLTGRNLGSFALPAPTSNNSIKHTINHTYDQVIPTQYDDVAIDDLRDDLHGMLSVIGCSLLHEEGLNTPARKVFRLFSTTHIAVLFLKPLSLTFNQKTP